jgi:hypothetical protein
MSDTTQDEPGTVATLLIANRTRRREADAQVKAAKEELRSLLLRGQALTMEVADMANQAGISRDTAHRILRDAGTMSWNQKRAWADEVVKGIPPNKSDIGQQIFRSAVEMSLYSALGSRKDDVPHSLEAIFEQATKTVRDGGRPDFTPHLDTERLAELPPWPVEPFEIVQKGVGETATFQLRLRGIELDPWRHTAGEVARDLKRRGGNKPTYIDRTGPECATPDGRRVGWMLLKDLD